MTTLHDSIALLAQGQGGGDFMTMIIYLGIFMVIFYYIAIRPQKKRQQQHSDMVKALKTGDRIITAGGIHGMITNTKEHSVMLKVADNVKIEVLRTSIDRVVKSAEGGEEESANFEAGEASKELAAKR